MNITSAQYETDGIREDNTGIKAIIDGIEMHIPLDPDNMHYAEIKKQVDAGTLTIKDAE